MPFIFMDVLKHCHATVRISGCARPAYAKEDSYGLFFFLIGKKAVYKLRRARGAQRLHEKETKTSHSPILQPCQKPHQRIKVINIIQLSPRPQRKQKKVISFCERRGPRSQKPPYFFPSTVSRKYKGEPPSKLSSVFFRL